MLWQQAMKAQIAFSLVLEITGRWTKHSLIIFKFEVRTDCGKV